MSFYRYWRRLPVEFVDVLIDGALCWLALMVGLIWLYVFNTP